MLGLDSAADKQAAMESMFSVSSATLNGTELLTVQLWLQSIISWNTVHSVFVLSFLWARQLSRNIPAGRGILWDKAAMLGEEIKHTPVYIIV